MENGEGGGKPWGQGWTCSAVPVDRGASSKQSSWPWLLTVFPIVVNPAPRGRWTHERWVLLGRLTSQRTASEFFFLKKKLALFLMLF